MRGSSQPLGTAGGGVRAMEWCHRKCAGRRIHFVFDASVAWQMSDPQAADNLRATAAQHSARAAELEKQTELVGLPADCSRELD
jgi:hypothetical protein